MGEPRVGLFPIEGVFGEAASALTQLEQEATIGGEGGENIRQRLRITRDIGETGSVSVDEVGELARQGVDQRQPRRRVVAGLVGHRHERLRLHRDQTDVAFRQELGIGTARQESMDHHPRRSGDRRHVGLESRLELSRSGDMDVDSRSRGGEPAGRGDDGVEILPLLEAPGIDAGQRPRVDGGRRHLERIGARRLRILGEIGAKVADIRGTFTRHRRQIAEGSLGVGAGGG